MRKARPALGQKDVKREDEDVLKTGSPQDIDPHRSASQRLLARHHGYVAATPTAETSSIGHCKQKTGKEQGQSKKIRYKALDSLWFDTENCYIFTLLVLSLASLNEDCVRGRPAHLEPLQTGEGSFEWDPGLKNIRQLQPKSLTKKT